MVGAESAYLAICHLPFVDYSARDYGILGTGILIACLFCWCGTGHCDGGRSPGRPGATWTLCGIFGIVTYALQPQTMIARGLQPAAQMLHIARHCGCCPTCARERIWLFCCFRHRWSG